MSELEHNGDGRDAQGRFTIGNRGGSPAFAKRLASIRSAIYAAVSDADVVKIMAAMVSLALDEKGRPRDRIMAAQFVMDRLVGQTPPADLIESVEELEQKIASILERKSI